MNFNSRPSARGDFPFTNFHEENLISIHAPPRGATTWIPFAQNVGQISIHAPPRGATSGGRIIDGVEIISIHAPPRGATAAARKQRHPVQISIHAPPRGATFPRSASGRTTSFQFTPLREGRLDSVGEKGKGLISIHAPPRGATWQPTRRAWMDTFQFTPLREGRLLFTMCIIPPVYFNSRPSARGDLSGAATARTTIRFQFTPLREGRRMRTCSPTCPLSFQFTPLREGRRRRGACGGPAAVISIHAPPRGATRPSRWRFFQADISIHAPPRGATRRVPGLSQHGGNFNSRPSARGDNAEKSDIVMPQDFNSRPSARGDQTTSTSTFAIWRFQFTPLREGRHQWGVWVTAYAHFNSRPSARGDEALQDTCISVDAISIHAPPRGATAQTSWIGGAISISIHAPPRGATTLGQKALKTGAISIHAPPRGATTPAPNNTQAQFISIHAPPRGATSGQRPPSLLDAHFNSRPSARGDPKGSKTGIAK